MREKMIQLLKDAGAPDAIEKYVDFCLENAYPQKIPHKTSHHHILPQAKSLPFTQFSNLNKNEWNGVHLTYKDHFKAHALLAIYFPHFATANAFNKMSNQDTKLNTKGAKGVEAILEFIEEESELYHKATQAYSEQIADTVYMRKGEKCQRFHKKDVEIKIKEGWVLGGPDSKQRGYVRITNGVDNKLVQPKTAIWYLADGWRYGMTADFSNRNNKGMKNPSASIIRIYDSNDVLRYEFKGTFSRVREENPDLLPWMVIINSYQYYVKTGEIKRLYEGHKSQFSRVKPHNKKFKGWYAIKL